MSQPDSIAIDAVAAHFQRSAAFYQAEAIRLAAQVREMEGTIAAQARALEAMAPKEPRLVPRRDPLEDALKASEAAA